MLKTVGTVREREREHNSNELSFICDAQNIVLVRNKNIEETSKYINNKRQSVWQ